MFVHYIFEHPYTRALIIFILCIILAFIDRIPTFKKRKWYYALCVLFGLILFANVYNDFGLTLLLIALIVMTYANLVAA
jgi:hypothetical protein